jgi:hypothetical protein
MPPFIWYRLEVRNSAGTAIKLITSGSDLLDVVSRAEKFGLETGDQIIIKVEN